jgi:hypothetical protein
MFSGKPAAFMSLFVFPFLSLLPPFLYMFSFFPTTFLFFFLIGIITAENICCLRQLGLSLSSQI